MIPVKPYNPCPVCGKPNWCLIEEDGSAAICQRVSEGAVKRAGEAGWLHKLTDAPRQYRPRHKPKPKPKIDFYSLAKGYQANLNVVSGLAWHLAELSALLGVSMGALHNLEVGWNGRNYTFPMRNGHGKIVGIRIRGEKKKWCVEGSTTGLFWPVGVTQSPKETLWVCEGPTDTAAMLDMGFEAIGRPSCSGGTEDIKILLRGHKRTVVIFSDKDTPKTRPDGSQWFPGQEGAMRLAKAIKSIVASVRVVKPPLNKDIRAWYNDGATRGMVLAIAENVKYL